MVSVFVDDAEHLISVKTEVFVMTGPFKLVVTKLPRRSTPFVQSQIVVPLLLAIQTLIQSSLVRSQEDVLTDQLIALPLPKDVPDMIVTQTMEDVQL